MPSILAEQLQQIRSTSQTTLDKKRHLDVKSLCFTKLDAAEQDLETVFAFAYNGFIHLLSLEPRLEKYADTLFSESSITFERDLQTRKKNDELDRMIEGALALLSPHFASMPGIKAIEWLVRRYRYALLNELIC